MSSQVGTVEFIKPHGRAFNAKIDGEWYGLGFQKPKFDVGAQVEFDVTQNGNFKNATVTKVLEATVSKKAPVPTTSSSTMSKDDYWSRKEERDLLTQKGIQLQSSRNSAIAVVDVAVRNGLIKLPVAQNKQFDVVMALVAELTAQFDDETTAHVHGTAKPAVTKDTPNEEEDPE